LTFLSSFPKIVKYAIFPIEAKYQKYHSEKISLPTGITSFIREYQPKRAIVANNNLSQKKRIENTIVEFVPFYFFSKILLR